MWAPLTLREDAVNFAAGAHFRLLMALAIACTVASMLNHHSLAQTLARRGATPSTVTPPPAAGSPTTATILAVPMSRPTQ